MQNADISKYMGLVIGTLLGVVLTLYATATIVTSDLSVIFP